MVYNLRIGILYIPIATIPGSEYDWFNTITAVDKIKTL